MDGAQFYFNEVPFDLRTNIKSEWLVAIQILTKVHWINVPISNKEQCRNVSNAVLLNASKYQKSLALQMIYEEGNTFNMCARH